MTREMMFTIFAVVLTVCSISELQAKECKRVNANSSFTADYANLAFEGIITRGGLLSGQTNGTYSPQLIPTLDGDTYNYITEETITTKKGTLTIRSVSIINFSNLFFTAIGAVTDGSGIFADATGDVIIYGASDDNVYFERTITGEICLSQ